MTTAGGVADLHRAHVSRRLRQGSKYIYVELLYYVSGLRSSDNSADMFEETIN